MFKFFDTLISNSRHSGRSEAETRNPWEMSKTTGFLPTPVSATGHAQSGSVRHPGLRSGI